MGEKENINATTSPSLVATFHPSDYPTTTTTTTAAAALRPHYHLYYYNSCGGGGGSSSGGSSKKMHRHRYPPPSSSTDHDNPEMTTTSNNNNDNDNNNSCLYSSREHNGSNTALSRLMEPAGRHNSSASAASAASLPPSSTSSSSRRRRCCCTAAAAAPRLSSPLATLSPATPSPRQPLGSGGRCSAGLPLRLWTTFVACAFLLTFSLAGVRAAGAQPQLKLNDIQSYLKSLDNVRTTGTSPPRDKEPVSLMWGIGDTTAYVGRLFTYRLPGDAFKGDIQSFKVMEAGKQELPRWLYFNADTRTFHGVAKTSDIAQYYIEVAALSGGGQLGQFAKDVFSIHVTRETSRPAAAPAAAAAVSSPVLSAAGMTGGGASSSSSAAFVSSPPPPPPPEQGRLRRRHDDDDDSGGGGGDGLLLPVAAASPSGRRSPSSSPPPPPPPVVRCMPRQPETAFTLVVDADLDRMSPHGIVGLLRKLESNLELVPEMFKVSPAASAVAGGNRGGAGLKAGADPVFNLVGAAAADHAGVASTAPLVSGPGDKKTASHPGVLVTWLVGCGSVERGHMDVLQRVEAISADGTLSGMLGHGVLGWHVTNRRRVSAHTSGGEKERRVRRAAAIMSTPVVTPIAPTKTRGGETGMTHAVPTMESSVVQPTRTHHPHKTHRPEGLTTLHPSTTGPRGGSTLKTKSLPDRMYTMAGGDSSMTHGGSGLPSILPTKPAGGGATAMAHYCSLSGNKKPRVAHRIPVQVFEAGKLAQFAVSPDTFVDCKDPSDQLKLAFFRENFKMINDTFWLQQKPGPPANSKAMVGLPMQSDVGVHNMTVVAVNSEGLRDYLEFQVRVLPDPNVKGNKVTHEIKMKFNMEFGRFMSSLVSKLDLVNKIGKLYGDEDSRKITVLSMKEGSVVVSWTNNTLAGSSCPNDATKALFSKIVDEKKQVKRSAKKALKPFKLQSAQIIPKGPCMDEYSIMKPSSTLHPGKGPVTTDPKLTKEPTSDDNDILISTVVPAVIIVSILLLALLVACILYRKKRKGKMSLSGTGGDHDAYAGKGAPVIFAEELEDKPTDCQRPLILDDEKPPHHHHPPPEYQHSSSESAQSTPNQERRRAGHHVDGMGGADEPILGGSRHQPYEPPPPVTASQGNKKHPRPHVQPPYRSPPPYVPP